jgi:uncharacterized protein YkwD
MTTSSPLPRYKFPRLRLVGLSIAALLVVAALFGTVLTSGAKAAVSYTDQEIAFINQLNNYRASKGLARLLISDSISVACDRHNSDMAKYKYFDHVTQKSDFFAVGSYPWDRMADCGYDYYTSEAENIAAGQQTAAQVFSAWKASSGHNANMLSSSYKVIGVSEYVLSGSPYTYYWTTDFGGYVDPTAHAVNAAPTPTTTRFQQNDGHFAYGGTWSKASASYFSGGSYAYSNGPASVTVSFTGTYLAWISASSAGYGIAKVTVDDNSPVTVDLYSSSVQYGRKVWNTGTLASGKHTVTIEWTGTKRAAATGSYVGVDAFDIIGTVSQTSTVVSSANTTVYQQTDPLIDYGGTWSKAQANYFSGGSYAYTNTSASVTVSFDGTYFGWITATTAGYGTAKVTLDNNSPVMVDLYSSSVQYGRRVWNTGVIAAGQHTVKIEWTGTKRAAATSAYIGADAFEVDGTLN